MTPKSHPMSTTLADSEALVSSSYIVFLITACVSILPLIVLIDALGRQSFCYYTADRLGLLQTTIGLLQIDTHYRMMTLRTAFDGAIKK